MPETTKEKQIKQLKEEFGEGSFTSLEACEALGIEWIEFIDTFVALQKDSGKVQMVGSKNSKSLYQVIEE